MQNTVVSVFAPRFKIMAFALCGLSVSLPWLLGILAGLPVLETDFWTTKGNLFIVLAFLSVSCFGCLPLLGMKRIRIGPQNISFQSYLFPSRVKVMNWKAYDFYYTICEESEHGSYEAVWLVKHGKLVDSFSSFKYSNYKELKSKLDLEDRGILELPPLKQLCC